MKITLTKRCFIGMMVFLPALLSCTTIEHESYTELNEPPKKVVAKLAPVATDYGKIIKITSPSDALFDFDSAALKTSSTQILESFTRELQDIQNNFIVIVYTDRLGTNNYNKKLSLRRAETVKIYLISKGIDPNRISIEGKGESNSVTGDKCGESMERAALIDCLSPDRRVEVKVIDIQ